MQPRHIALAVLLSVFWGLNFVVITIALGGFPPVFLAALRFAIAGLPALVLPRPALPWSTLIAISFTLFVVQFALLFTGMAIGMPPGIASILVQVQGFFTIAIAAAVLRERPTGRQLVGCAVALAGLALVATTAGSNGITMLGFTLTLGSAVLWAIGNVLLRRAGATDIFALISWLAAIACGPLFVIALILEGPDAIGSAVTHATWLTVAAVLYIALASTVFGYWAWGRLLSLYPAATAAPFSLLVPVSGTISAALILHESFGPVRLAGMAFILAGLAVLVLRRRPPILR
ncbi:MAG TPA: EamA family transporter [Bauldia sp.]|nr:EamA family transporter [Bauldia sp.]